MAEIHIAYVAASALHFHLGDSVPYPHRVLVVLLRVFPGRVEGYVMVDFFFLDRVIGVSNDGDGWEAEVPPKETEREGVNYLCDGLRRRWKDPRSETAHAHLTGPRGSRHILIRRCPVHCIL